MVLTAVTVAVAFVNLGSFNFPVAIGIAITKATLVILFFMHAKYSSQLTKLFVGDRVLLPAHPARPVADRLPVARDADLPGGAAGAGYGVRTETPAAASPAGAAAEH